MVASTSTRCARPGRDERAEHKFDDQRGTGDGRVECREQERPSSFRNTWIVVEDRENDQIGKIEGDSAAKADAAVPQHRGGILPTCPSWLAGVRAHQEHNLAKVGVEGSNPFARSKTKPTLPWSVDGLRVTSGVTAVARISFGVEFADSSHG
jgi:hypothetical protein